MRERVKAADRIGQQFGRLTVLQIVGRYRTTAVFECLCDCGNRTKVTCSSLVSGNTQSCGCLHRERAAEAATATFTRHGKTNSKEYNSWRGMLSRCTDEGCNCYHDYGGRGITVCEEWLSFENFYRDMGDKPSPRHSLDRKDNSKGCCKENCRWATPTEQTNNQRSNRLLTLEGRTQTLSQWSREVKISRKTLLKRIRLGWSDEKVLTTPAREDRTGGCHARNK